MTLQEAEKKFALPIKTLEEYAAFGFIRRVEDADDPSSSLYRDEDFDRLGLVQMLVNAGFTLEETGRYLSLTEREGTDGEQIRMLRKRRGILLTDIHERQRLLDQIDFMIWKKKNGRGSIGS